MSRLYQSQRYDRLRGILSSTIIPQVYNLIFSTPEFPYWFIFQCYFAIVLSSKSLENCRFRPFFSLIITMSVALAPSIFFDIVIGQTIPFSESWKSFLLCFILWLVTEMHQTKLLKKVINGLSVIFGPIHIFGMMRCLQFYNDESRQIDWIVAYICGILISISDLVVAKILIKIFRGNSRTPFTRPPAFLRMISLYTLFFCLTEENPINIIFGVLPYKPVGLFLCIFFGAMEFAVHALDTFDVVEAWEKEKVD